MPKVEKSGSGKMLLRSAHSGLGTAMPGADRITKFEHIQPKPFGSEPHNLRFMRLFFGESHIDLPVDNFDKAGRKALKKAAKNVLMRGAPAGDGLTAGERLQMRKDAIKNALSRFGQKDKQEKWFRLGEQIGNLIMDYHGLDTWRHIGSEVSLKVPYAVDANGAVRYEHENGTRDIFMYGRNSEGARLGVSIELQTKLGLAASHKFLYGLMSNVKVSDYKDDYVKKRAKGKQYERIEKDIGMLNHNIIITRSISPQLCRALGLEKSSRGYSIARPRIDVFPENAELESMIDEGVADMKWPVTSRFFKRGRLAEMDENMGGVRSTGRVRGAKRERLLQRASDLERGLKRTSIVIADSNSNRIKQIVIFEKDQVRGLKPIILDWENYTAYLKEADLASLKRAADSLWSGYLLREKEVKEEGKGIFERLKPAKS